VKNETSSKLKEEEPVSNEGYENKAKNIKDELAAPALRPSQAKFEKSS